MSESIASFEYEDVSTPEGSHVKKDMHLRASAMDESDVIAVVNAFGLPEDLHPRVPPTGMTMDQLPEDAIGLYAEYFFEGGLACCSFFYLSFRCY